MDDNKRHTHRVKKERSQKSKTKNVEWERKQSKKKDLKKVKPRERHS